MKLKIYRSILLLVFVFFTIQSYGQKDATRLIKINKVKSLELYVRQIKPNASIKNKKILISKVEFNKEGQSSIEIHYNSKGKEDFKHLYFYNSVGFMDSSVYIKGNDTMVSHYNDTIELIKMITGGIPDYFPKYDYYTNGLLKSRTVILGNAKEALYEYEYYYE